MDREYKGTERAEQIEQLSSSLRLWVPEVGKRFELLSKIHDIGGLTSDELIAILGDIILSEISE